eukprot:gene60497-80680_t
MERFDWDDLRFFLAGARSGRLTAAARRLGQQVDATLFMTLLAAFATLLHRLSGQRELIVGTPVRGRD